MRDNNDFLQQLDEFARQSLKYTVSILCGFAIIEFYMNTLKLTLERGVSSEKMRFLMDLGIAIAFTQVYSGYKVIWNGIQYFKLIKKFNKK